jgi:hypothetical protein
VCLHGVLPLKKNNYSPKENYRACNKYSPAFATFYLATALIHTHTAATTGEDAFKPHAIQ